ncbi:MAG: cupin domain-containing protein [Solirubrobacterales bacterium]
MSGEAVESGEGWSVAALDDLGEGPGFRKIRRALGVEEFGVNGIVIPAGYDTGYHLHEVQEELYIVLDGTIEIGFNDGTAHVLEAGGLARVAAPVHRKVRNVGEADATYIVVGAKGGYVGRDGLEP